MAAALIYLLIKAAAEAYQLRMKLIRKFMEYAGNAGMALFITSEADELCNYADPLIWLHQIATAYTLFLCPPLLIARYGEEIKNTIDLDQFFQQFDVYKEWKAEIKRRELSQLKNDVDEDLIKQILTFYDAMKDSVDLKFFTTYTQELFNFITSTITELIKSSDKDPRSLINYINQHFGKNYSVETCFLNPNIPLLFHPTLDLDWTVLKTMIILINAYEDLAYYACEKKLCGQPFFNFGTNRWFATGTAPDGTTKTITLKDFRQTLDREHEIKVQKQTLMDNFICWKPIDLYFWHEGVTSNKITVKPCPPPPILPLAEDWIKGCKQFVWFIPGWIGGWVDGGCYWNNVIDMDPHLKVCCSAKIKHPAWSGQPKYAYWKATVDLTACKQLILKYGTSAATMAAKVKFKAFLDGSLKDTKTILGYSYTCNSTDEVPAETTVINTSTLEGTHKLEIQAWQAGGCDITAITVVEAIPQ